MIRDLTSIDTVYRKQIRTINLKLTDDYVASPDADLDTIGGPDDVFSILRAIFSNLDDDQEHVILLVLNQPNRITGFKLISSGAQDYSIIDCKVLFRNALLLGAQQIIIAHNHPTGNLEPSEDDIRITEKIVQAGNVIDIDVLDHIIYTPHDYCSIKVKAPSIFD